MEDSKTKAALGETLIDATTGIVSSYLRHNTLQAGEIPALISSVHAALMNGSSGVELAPVEEEKKEPAVPIKKSIHDDYIVCLEDGLKFKSLKRHLRARYNMTPEMYRKKWGLPDNYPMVSPAYARKRSALAKGIRLGQV